MMLRGKINYKILFYRNILLNLLLNFPIVSEFNFIQYCQYMTHTFQYHVLQTEALLLISDVMIKCIIIGFPNVSLQHRNKIILTSPIENLSILF